MAAAAAKQAAARQAARAFCAFLERRLRARNVAMLRLLLDDFFAGRRAAALRDFVALGATMVVLQPFNQLDAEPRRQAARLLDEQREITRAVLQPDDPMLPATPWRSLREREQRCCAWVEFLGARVCVRNLSWLYEMMAQFLLGKEQRIQEFVGFGGSVVSIVPVEVGPDTEAGYAFDDGGSDAHLLLSTVCGNERSENEDDCASETAAPRAKKRSGFFGAANPSEENKDDDHSDTGDDSEEDVPATPRKRRRRQTINGEDSKMRQQQIKILELFDKVEASKPWEKVYHKDLKLPVNETEHPRLATALRTFFAKYRRAVWERNFWAPISREHDYNRAEMRKQRQGAAVKWFQANVIEPAYHELGAEFFVNLDRQQPRPEGWWFRSKIVDLHTMFRGPNGPAVMREYLETQSTTLNPRSGSRGRRYKNNSNSVSESMWSPNHYLEVAVKEIRELKQRAAQSSHLAVKEVRLTSAGAPNPDEVNHHTGNTEEASGDEAAGKAVGVTAVLAAKARVRSDSIGSSSSYKVPAEASTNTNELVNRVHERSVSSVLSQPSDNEGDGDNHGGGQLVLTAPGGLRSRSPLEDSDSDDDKSLSSHSSFDDQDSDEDEENTGKSAYKRGNYQFKPPRLHARPGGSVTSFLSTEESRKEKGQSETEPLTRDLLDEGESADPRSSDQAKGDMEHEDKHASGSSPDEHSDGEENPTSPKSQDQNFHGEEVPTRSRSHDHEMHADSDADGEEEHANVRSPRHDLRSEESPTSSQPQPRNDAEVSARLRSLDDTSSSGSEAEGQQSDGDGDVVDLTVADSPSSSDLDMPRRATHVRWRTDSEGVIIFDDEDAHDEEQRARNWGGIGW